MSHINPLEWDSFDEKEDRRQQKKIKKRKEK